MTQNRRPDRDPAPRPVGQDGRSGPGEETQAPERTPGDGSLQGATPAGLTVEELRRRAEDTDRPAEPGTG